MKNRVINVKLDPETLALFDKYNVSTGFSSRSHAMTYLIQCGLYHDNKYSFNVSPSKATDVNVQVRVPTVVIDRLDRYIASAHVPNRQIAIKTFIQAYM